MDTHTVFPLAFFHRDARMSKADIHWPAKSIAAPPLLNSKDQKRDWYENEFITMVDANTTFTTYCHPAHRSSKRILFTHLGGGIGDVIAFSALAEFLKGKTIMVHCDPRHFPVFKWFSNQNLRIKPFYDVIVPDFTAANRLTRYSTYARLRMEWAAIEAREKNWYDAMFQRIHLPAAPKGFNVPHLVRRTDMPGSVQSKKSVLICHRASCQMRSSRFEDFYWPVKNALPGYKIYVHQVDLSPADIQFLQDNKLNDVGIILKTTLEQYLANLYHAEMVVCTDTAAVHFREGVRKPCLAVFGAISSSSRTSGYKHTVSFDVNSPCEHQPCFIHETRRDQVCFAAQPGDITASCQSGEAFQTQLYENLKSCRP